MPLSERGQKTLWLFTGVFLFIGVLTAVATEQVLLFVTFLPALYAVFSNRLLPCSKLIVAAAVPASFIWAPGYVHGVVLYASLIACGVLLQWFLDRRNVGMAVFAPSCIMFFLIVLNVAIIAMQEDASFQDVVSGWAERIMVQIDMVYNRILPPRDLAEFRASRAAVQERITDLFWGIAASSALTVMWLNLLISARVTKKVRMRSWKSPDWFVGFFILAALLILVRYWYVPQDHEVIRVVSALQVLGMNLMIVVSQVYFFHGLAVVAAIMDGYNLLKVIRLAGYILIFSQKYIMIAVIVLGLFDTWFNFRKMIRSSEGDIT